MPRTAPSDEGLILQGVLRLARQMRRSAGDKALTGGALGMLATLHRDGPTSAVELARREGLQPQSLSRLLVRLDESGLIARSIDPEDARRHVIAITAAGEAALWKQMKRRRDWLAGRMAERLGFEERQTLIEAAHLMMRMATTDFKGPIAPAVLAAEPQLFVSDLDSSLAFFTNILGFRIAFIFGEPAFYAQVVRDGARLNLRRVEGPVFASDFRHRESDALSATLTVGNVGELFADFDEKGMRFHQRLRDEPWGVQSFIAADPDGNLIAFVGR